MRCIYCLEDSSASRGAPHVIPEALGKNEFLLPVGSVCDDCNHYLGHELDSVLVAHPIVSLLVQFLELPGKNGKPRKVLGNVARDVHPRAVTIPTDRPVFSYENGTRTATASVLVPRNFSLSKFRRALHHVALNLIAKHYGVERALDAQFDAVRTYVRKPAKAERWPYAQHMGFDKGLTRDLTLSLTQEEEPEIVIIGVADAAMFAVDPLNTGKLAAWAKRELPPGSTFVDASDDVPRESPRKAGREYRLSICIDE